MVSINTSTQTPKTSNGQLLILVGIILTSLNLRAAVTSLSDLVLIVAKDIPHFSPSLMGILPLLCFAIFGALAPSVKNKLGFEKSLLISMIMVGLGLVLRATCSNFYVFVLNSITALIGMSFGNVLLPPLFKKYFPNNTGHITALYSVLIAVSAGLPSIISADTVGLVGWRIDIGLWGLLGFAAAIPWLLQVIKRPDLTKASDAIEDGKFKPVYKWKQAWAMALLFGVGGMLPMYTIIDWLPTYLEEQHLTIKAAGMALFLYNTLGIVHSFLVPLIIGKLKHPYILIIIAFVLQVAGYLGFMFNVERAMLWAVIAAPGLLVVPAVFQLFNLRTRTPQGATHLSSFVQCIGYLFAVVGPMLFGSLKSISGGYMVPFTFLLLMSLVMAIAGIFALRKNYLEDE